jgi:transposase-like protein
MADKRKKYTKEFKLDAIRLLESGTKPGHEIERDLAIGKRADLLLAKTIQ